MQLPSIEQVISLATFLFSCVGIVIIIDNRYVKRNDCDKRVNFEDKSHAIINQKLDDLAEGVNYIKGRMEGDRRGKNRE